MAAGEPQEGSGALLASLPDPAPICEFLHKLLAPLAFCSPCRQGGVCVRTPPAQ